MYKTRHDSIAADFVDSTLSIIHPFTAASRKRIQAGRQAGRSVTMMVIVMAQKLELRQQHITSVGDGSGISGGSGGGGKGTQNIFIFERVRIKLVYKTFCSSTWSEYCPTDRPTRLVSLGVVSS